MTRTFLTIISLYFILGIFEVFFPAEIGQKPKGRFRNALFTMILVATGAAFLAWILPLIPFKAQRLPDRGWGFSLLVVFAYLFLTDLLFYWYHRAQHHFKWFWPIHELHHSDTELNATTSMRTYWLERPLQASFIVLPLNYAIGADATASLILPFLFTGWLFFTHANLKLNLGFATPILTGPQMHRIHHSNQPQHQNKNFAQFFPIIDIIFGTYYRPAKNEYPTTGTPGLATDASLWTVMMRPAKVWVELAKRT
ncbi:sterol desaturase family protein [Patescibacteria group bacterium]|jgi:sterol desaturase/sphingolipid hydroxylase (fatty acid hydroxylase superfamily)|nr:sterol desaturase family protein [Patescibacteria group bacterium]